MGRPTDPLPSVTLQVLREISARRDSRPEIAVPPVVEEREPPAPRDEPTANEPPR